MIHFGGDEVHFGWHQWPKLPEVAALMKREKFTELADTYGFPDSLANLKPGDSPRVRGIRR